MTKRMGLRNRGFSLVEVAVVLVMSALVLLGAVQGFRKLNRSLGLLRTHVEEAADIALGSEIVVRDFGSLAASFNLVKQNDDCGDSFFKYSEDVACSGVHENFEDQDKTVTCGSSHCARVKTLAQDREPSEKSTIVFLSEDNVKHSHEVDFTPASLFKYPTTGGALSLNTGEPKKLIDTASESLKQQSFWNPKRLMLVQTVGPFKNPAVGGSVLKKVSYIGVMESDGSLSQPDTSFFASVDLSHSSITAEPTGFVDFLYKLPFAAGRQPLLTSTRVQLVRYFLKATSSHAAASGELIRQVWDPAAKAFVDGITVSPDVKSARFIRSSTGSDVVSFRIRALHEENSKLVTDSTN